MRKQEMPGHLLALFTAFIWGTSFIATKVLLVSFSPLEILFFRFLLGYLILWLLYPHRVKLKTKKEEWWLFLAALTGVTVYFLCENTALTYSFASNVGVLVSVAPFLTGVMSHLSGSEKLNRRFVLGFLISILGIFCISYNGTAMLKLNPLGDILALLAALMWAFYSIFTQRVNQKHAYPLIGVTRKIFFYGLLTMLPCMLFLDFNFWEPGRLGAKQILNLSYLGILCSGVGYITWNKAMKTLGTMKASAYIYLIPLITMLFSALILKEHITWIAILGTVLILSGLLISEWKKSTL